ncbi:Swarming motility protein SwrC [Bacillus coahuilensis p1.1.43]|uniref:Swarming motility protein SwrC n=1 Tax=Bacillus coahuilensis p1.1.43 TaxID=1150625 RepID=A0A147KC77_9BACI|nr:efflux RND transporter permease subunit [Bacillus coahuilensis]KUP09124.1 Swarming motility protein SwrC [Bacillus coahuilensis p1.1.43]
MNGLINFNLKNKFAVWLITIIVTVAGLYSGFNMKLETLPDINTPIVSVTTVYPGATPEEVADKVSEPIEKKLQNANGLNVISSTSFQNASFVQLEYKFSKDMDEAVEEVEEALKDVEFPEGVEDPETSRLSFNAFPVITTSIAHDDMDLATLTQLVEEDIVPSIEGLDGVGSVEVSGQQLEEVQLIFDQEKLSELGLTEDTVTQVIQASDVTFPLGLYAFGETEKSVVVDGNATTLEELEAIQIPVIPAQAAQSEELPPAGAQGQGQPGQVQNQTTEAPQSFELPTVSLSELAEIEIVGEAESISRTNGKESIALSIVKGADDNTVDVVDAVKEELAKFEDEVDGIEIVHTFDQGEPIVESVNTMLSKALFGALFAVIIIMLFLRDIKSTIISVISIPLSLLIALLVLNQLDITLNIMTLGAMTVAIGRVVDDSIVVIENIYRRMSLKGETLTGMDLIRESTKEMFVPIFSSTIVTVAVFLPLGLVEGMIGELFLPFALTVTFALLASLIVAITVVPMLAHMFFKKGVKLSHEEKPSKMANGYKRILNWSLNHKIITSLVAIAMLVGSFFLVPFIGVSFIPSEEEKMVIASYQPEPGQQLEDVISIAQEAEDYFEGKADVETIQYSVGGENPMSPGSSNEALFYVMYNDDTEEFESEKEQVIEDLQGMSEKGEWASQDFASTGGNSATYYIYGDSLEDIEPVVNEIKDVMEADENFRNVDTSISETYEEYTLVADQEKLSQLGLTPAQVGMALMTQYTTPVLTTIEKDGKDLNVYVEVESEEYSDIEDLTDKTIPSALGFDVPISDVVEVKEGNTSDTVTRRDGKLYVEVSGDIVIDDVTKATIGLQEEVDKIDIPSGIEVDTGGVSEDIASSFSQLGLAMLAAIAIVYLILVITFGGALAPFAILFSLPFAIIGGLVALLIAGETISISALIGALMLIGIVVTNAIVLIDRVLHKEAEGLSTREALLEAGATRLRPILMTAIATIGALFPLALGIEGSGLISRGLGVTVIGGLTSSTLLTLLIVPIVYEALMKLRRKSKAE